MSERETNYFPELSVRGTLPPLHHTASEYDANLHYSSNSQDVSFPVSLFHVQTLTQMLIYSRKILAGNHFYSTLSRHKWATTEPDSQDSTVWPSAA